MVILPRSGNEALNVNPPFGDHVLTVHGSDWLWAVTALYILSLLLVVGSAYFARSGEKIFHYLFTVSLFCGSVAYFTAASDLGNIPVLVANWKELEDMGTRQIFWSRYVYWFTSFPPLILALGLLSGISWATTIYNIALSLIQTTCLLCAALTSTKYKWGFFAFSLTSYLLLSLSLILTGNNSAKRLSVPHHKHYFFLSSYLVALWLIYAIEFGVDDGGNRIHVTAGWIFTGILDVLTGPVFIAGFLCAARKWEMKELGLYFTQYGRVNKREGEFPEKAQQPVAAGAAA